MADDAKKLGSNELMQVFDNMAPLMDLCKGMIKQLEESGFTHEDASSIVATMVKQQIEQATAEAMEQAKQEKRNKR